MCCRWFTLKTVCYRSPLAFSLTCLALSVFLFGYSLHILERPIQHEFALGPGLFVAFQCITTGWASDIFATYVSQKAE